MCLQAAIALELNAAIDEELFVVTEDEELFAVTEDEDFCSIRKLHSPSLQISLSPVVQSTVSAFSFSHGLHEHL